MPRWISRKCKLASSFALLLLQTGGAWGQANMAMCHAMNAHAPVPAEKLPPPQHMTGVGNVRFPITANAEAQIWFTQGINLYYDFWDYESERAFEQAIRSDANCSMCYWGLAQAQIFSHSENKGEAKASLDRAVALKKHASGRERMYIDAAVADEAADDDKAKAAEATKILRKLVQKNPNDTNARIVLSESIHDGYDDNGVPRKGLKEALEILQGVLKDEPENSAANHLWIHAVEASPHPEQALHSAEILGSLAPASGHMVHMPGHIYYRTGDYARAQAAFDASTVADESYMQQQKVAVDDDWNYVHNLMYSVANLLEAGQLQEAEKVSDKLVAARGGGESTLYLFSARDSMARLNPQLPVALRTADWARVIQLVNAAKLGQTMPNMEFLAGALSQFALGMQSVAAHEPDVAERHSVLLDASLFRLSQQVKDEQAADAKTKDKKKVASSDPLAEPLIKVLSIMSLELRGSMMATQNNAAEAEKLFAQAREQEKELGYHEPPFFIRPVAETEAAAMMTAGKWAEAKGASEKALVERPNSGFALYGIAEATEKSGDAATTAAAYRHFLSAWKGADPGLPQMVHAQQWLEQHAAVQTSDASGPQ
jgi:tetratricopeptide (TPR) repeat protein